MKENISNTIIKKIFLNRYISPYYNRIMNNSLWKGVFIIGTGAVIAQVIGVVTLPIITRLYSPSDFGILGLFMSTLAILIVLASLGYQFAIPIPEKESTTLNLCTLCILLTIIICSLISIAILLIGDNIAVFFNIELIMPYFWLIIIGLFGGSTYQILTYWAIRKQDYVTITSTQINQSISGVITKISLGAIGAGPFGLLAGQIISNIAGIGTLGKKFWRENIGNFQEISINNIRDVASKYRNFPIFSLPAQLVSAFGIQLPVFALSTIYGTEVAGSYILSYQIVTLPASIISGSIAQAFYAETAKNVRDNPTMLMPQFVETVKNLAYLSIPLIVIPSIFSPILFPIIFGDSWKAAGIYALPLALVAASSFIATPTSKLALYGCNHWEFGFHIARTCLLIFGFFMAYTLNLTPFLTLTINGILMMFTYGLLLLLNILAIKRIVSSDSSKQLLTDQY